MFCNGLEVVKEKIIIISYASSIIAQLGKWLSILYLLERMSSCEGEKCWEWKIDVWKSLYEKVEVWQGG